MARRKKIKKKAKLRYKRISRGGKLKVRRLKLTIKRKTNLKFLLDELGLSQSDLSVLANVKKYQVSLLASGTRPDCYLSTANRICKALSIVSHRKITLDRVFGDNAQSPPEVKSANNNPFLMRYLKKYFSNDSQTYSERTSLRNKIAHQLLKY